MAPLKQLLITCTKGNPIFLWCYAELGTCAEAVDHPARLMWAYYGVGLLALRQRVWRALW